MTDVIRWTAKLEPLNTNPDAGIPFLKWNQDTLLVESTGFLHFTDLQGQFTEKVNQATLNSKPIPVREDGTFDIHFGFPSDLTTFVIIANDSKNKTYQMEYKVTQVEKKKVVLEKIKPKRLRFSAGGGLTRLSFRQDLIGEFSQWAVTIKGNASYNLIPEKLDLGLSTFFNLVPFSTTSVDNYKIQYLGVNLRVVKNIIGPPSRWRMNLSAGIYFNTSLSTVGFYNMFGPQLYPEVIYVFKNGNSLLWYGKFSPVISNGQIVSVGANREVATGVHYSFPINSNKRLSIGIDLSQLNLSMADGPWASTNTYSLSAGVSF